MARPEGVARFDLEQHLFFWLTQTIGSRDRQLGIALRDFGLRVPEYRALAALCARRRCSMSELADLASIDRTTLTRTIDRMTEAGWVKRLDDDSSDLRVRRLAPSASGQKLFDRIWPVVEGLNRAALDGLTAAERTALLALLRRMKHNLDRGQQPAGGGDGIAPPLPAHSPEPRPPGRMTPCP